MERLPNGFNGTNYNEPPILPSGLSFTFTDDQSNQLPFTPDTSYSSTIGASVRDSIGYIEVTQTGSIDIDVAGSINPRVFSFSQSFLWRLMGAIFGSLALVFVAFCAGVGIMIWGLVKLLNNKRDEPVTVEPSI